MSRLRTFAVRLALLSAAAAACGQDPVAPEPEPAPRIPDGLWAVSGSASALLHLAPAQLSGSGDRVPDTRITTPDGGLRPLASLAFGPDGRLWISTADGSRVVAFAPAALGTSGSRTATTEITPVGGSLSAPMGLAFDAAQGLWVANFSSGTLVRFDPAQLSAGGALEPGVVISGAGQPTALAFDAAGSLWVADYQANRILRYDPSQLAATGSPTPAVLTAADSSLRNPSGLAFDAAGNLWVSNLSSATVVAFSTGQLQSPGARVPRVVLSSDRGSLTLPAGLAFDADGSLWVLGGTGSLTNFASASLGATGAPVPAARLQISGESLFWGVALSPRPAGLPLH
jgi:sugar lactone lactonase YvrE